MSRFACLVGTVLSRLTIHDEFNGAVQLMERWSGYLKGVAPDERKSHDVLSCPMHLAFALHYA